MDGFYDPATQPLRGKVAVVAGATRGAGRGIACMLGERTPRPEALGEIVRVPLSQVTERIRSGELRDGFTLSALMQAQARGFLSL